MKIHVIKRLVTVLNPLVLTQVKGGTADATASADGIIDGDIDVF